MDSNQKIQSAWFIPQHTRSVILSEVLTSVNSILSYMFTSVTHIGYSNVADNLCWIRSSFVAINSTTLLPSNSNSSWWSFGPTSQSMDGSSKTTYFNSISINDSYSLWLIGYESWDMIHIDNGPISIIANLFFSVLTFCTSFRIMIISWIFMFLIFINFKGRFRLFA